MCMHPGAGPGPSLPRTAAGDMARSDNPRLFHKGLILCGTISGFMDPFAWFGILGGMLSGKVAAMAVNDPQGARREFARFNRNFRMIHFN